MTNFMSEDRMLRYKLDFYGYEKGRTVIPYDDSLKRITYSIMNLPENKKVNGFKCATSDIISKAKGVLDRHFDIHDVAYLSMEGFSSIIDGLSNGNSSIAVENLPKALKEVDEAVKIVSPFDLPIEYVEGHSLVAQIEKPISFVPNEEFMRELPVVFSRVCLGENITLVSSGTYGHEIIHSQLNSRKGSCLDYHNSEVLPIFGEKLIAFELDPSGELLAQTEKMRFRDLFERFAVLNSPNEFSRVQLVEASTYVVSTLQATNLFDKYINGDVGTQTDILSGIQDVFDGRSTVEELLEKVDVTVENSKDPILIKNHLK